MTEDLQDRQPAPEARPPEGMERLPWIDLSPLSVDKVIALHRFARDNDDWLRERIETVFDHLAELNPARAKEILTARIDSPLVQDRIDIAGSNQLYEFTKVDHDSGVELLRRVMSDRDPAVREEARVEFDERLYGSIPGSGDRGISESQTEWLKYADELELHEETGLYKNDAEALIKALASIDEYDPGREALRELQAANGHAY